MNSKSATVVSLMAVLLIATTYIYFKDRPPTAEEIAAGRSLFLHEWTVDDPLCDQGDGLGPVFNERSCVACHAKGGIGGSGELQHNVLAFEVEPHGERTEFVNHVVHANAIEPRFQETKETVARRFPKIKNARQVTDGPKTINIDHDPVLFQELNSPALFGVGLIDEIPAREIAAACISRFAKETSEQLNGNAQQNETGFLRTLSYGRVGKFGWQGQFASIEGFVASACAMEIGLSNDQFSQPIPQQHVEDSDAKPDMTRQQLRELVAFIKSLPRPVQVMPQDPSEREHVVEGEKLFREIRCTDCHIESIGDVDGIYTDFQLYSLELRFSGSASMGYGIRLSAPKEGTPDRREDGGPLPEHWQTPPLWGVADSAPYFHDGKSTTLEAAIMRHDGDAKVSKNLFDALGRKKQSRVIAFLKSLRAPDVEKLKL